MERVDQYVIALLAVVGLVVSANAIGKGLSDSATTETEVGDYQRWTVYQPNAAGWLIFDADTGRFCQVPNAQNPDQNINCTGLPQ